jgi:sugar lactone lactonase YvrE
LEKPTGLAVHPEGDLFLMDRQAGVLYRLTREADGTFTSSIVFAGLDEPVGIVREGEGHLLVAEKDKGRIVRLTQLGEAFSGPVPVVEGLKKPRWLVLDQEGNLFVSAEGLKDQKKPETPKKVNGDLILKVASDGTLEVVADRFKALRGLAFDATGSLYAAAKRRRDDEPKSQGTIFQITLPEGPVAPVIAGGFTRPRDLKFDALGALFFTAKEFQPSEAPEDEERFEREAETGQGNAEELEEREAEEHGKPLRGVILKATFKPDGTLHRLTTLAAGLHSPAGLAFNPQGHLYVAERRRGRVLRFQAPSSPVLDPLPRFARQGVVAVKGTAEANAKITILGGASPVSGLAAETSGTFALEVTLLPNIGQTLRVFATGARGDGLTSPPARAIVTHDDVAPETKISGPSGALLSPNATFTFTGTDNLTSPAQLRFASSLDGAPFTSFTETTTLTLTNLASGPHTLRVKAQDQAGNEDPTPAEQTVTVTGFGLAVTSPAPGATINGDRAFVTGTVTGTTTEVGVAVNGVLAFVTGGQWVVEVTLVQGNNVLNVTATDNSGAQVSTSLNVTVSQVASTPVLLRASPDSGVAPLVVTWQVLNQTGRPLGRFEFDETGTGTFGAPTTAFDGTQTTYTGAGLRLPVLRATDDQGTTYSVTAVVNVLDPAALNALLKTRWDVLKTALLAGDGMAALVSIASRARDGYATLFAGLGDRLSALGADMPTIQPVYLDGTFAKYRLRRQQNVGGGVITITHYIYFSVDDDGIWRIESF